MGRIDTVSRHAVRRRLAPPLVAALLLTAAAVAPASAAAQSVNVDRVLGSGSMDLGGTSYVISGVVNGTVDVTAAAVVTLPIRETLAYDDGSLRQGGDLAVTRSVAPNGPATVKVTWTVGGSFVNDSFSKTVSCAISLTVPTTCPVTSDGIRIFGHAPVPLTPFVDMVLQASVEITPDAGTVSSTELAGGAVIDGPNDQAEPGSQVIEIPCTTGAGDTLALSEADYAFAVHVDSSNGPAIEIGAWIPNPFFPIGPPAFEGPTASFDVGPQHEESFDQDLTDASTIVSGLGSIAANNVPPNADANGPYAGLEGVAIVFSAAGSTSICGFADLAFRWDFSDGGVAFGASPSHTFTDDGVFSGQLTATDPTGLSNVEAFSVTVGNQDPVANAGPDTTADWGRNVTFGGTATDPGAGDQSTLEYSWDFGDGTPPTEPSGSGGSGVLHAYAVPGDYVATLTVTDKDGGSDTDTRTVHVTKRDTTTAYVGPSSATFDTPTTLTASLTDEYGVAVNGRSIAFTVDGASVGSASTNSAGVASLAYTPLLAAGTYATGASFAGDSLYKASDDTGSLTIARKATTVTYTGALNGGPNKVVDLSAILADASGTRLAGRTITFVLGSQTATAVTDSNGVAIVNLKLTQKNGIYPLTATFAASGADATHYLGSSDAESFKLQKK
jgi:hypothetical protein